MMVRPKILPGVEKVCFYCRLKVPDKTSLALHYVRQHWDDVRRRQGQTYRPKPDAADVNKGRIFAAKPTTGNGGGLRRVKVSSKMGEQKVKEYSMRHAMIATEASKKSLVPEQQGVKPMQESFNDADDEDDAQRMARRQAMMAARRASMPAQKIKLVYPSNSNRNSGRGNNNGAQEMTMPAELERRIKLKEKVATGPSGPGVGNIVSKQVTSDSSRPATVGGLKLRDISELTNSSQKVSKVVEESHEEESIVVEDELLAQVCKQQKNFVVERDDVKMASGDSQEAQTKMEEVEKEMPGDLQNGILGGPEGSVAGKDIVVPMSDEADEAIKRLGQESTAEQIPTGADRSALYSPTMTPDKRKGKLPLPTIAPSNGALLGEAPTANPSVANRPGFSITLSKRKNTPKSSPISSSNEAYFGLNTTSPLLETRSRAMSSLIRSNENQVALEEAEECSNDNRIGNGGDGARRFGNEGQEVQGRCKSFEVRLVKLNKLMLQEAMRATGLDLVEEGDSDEDDFELKTLGNEDSKIQEPTKGESVGREITPGCEVRLKRLKMEELLTSRDDANEVFEQTEAEVPEDCEDMSMSKFFVKKNCVVKIAKMAWLDEVSRKERGQEKAREGEMDVDCEARMPDVGGEIPLEIREEDISSSGNPFWWM